jgi:hypothetical protein
MTKYSLIIPQKKPPSNVKSRLSGQSTLSLSTQEKKEVKSFLQIASVPVGERLNPKENRYILVVQPHGVRAAAGQYTAEEAYEIARLTKNWDWSLDANNRPEVLSALEILLDQLCRPSSPWKGGKA